jgi:hypothetical protein
MGFTATIFGSVKKGPNEVINEAVGARRDTDRDVDGKRPGLSEG